MIIEKDGKRHACSYTVERGVITVLRYGFHCKTTQLGNSPAGALASLLLSELLQRHMRKGVMKGSATVFRGTDPLGTVQYNFTLHDDGRVTGTVVHVDHVLLHQSVPRVPPAFLPPSVVETDLYLRLSDGTAVDFLIADTTGRIENGRRRQE